jgi:hypothetical protein
MTTLLQHSKAELRAAGLFDDDSDFNGEIAVQVTALMETLYAYNHSGSSLAMTLDVFDKVARHMPLTPLTGEDDEWEAVGGTDQLVINKRCRQVFKDDAMAWDVRKGRIAIRFPYSPDAEMAYDARYKKGLTNAGGKGRAGLRSRITRTSDMMAPGWLVTTGR